MNRKYFNETLQNFIENNSKSTDLCNHYQEYKKNTIKILDNVYKLSKRFMLRDTQIIALLNSILEVSDKHSEKELLMIKEKEFEKEKQFDLNVTSIAKFLGISKTTIYNIKNNKYANKCTDTPKYKLNENELKIINKASDITITDYEVKNREITIDNLINIIEDLLDEIEHKEDKIIELEKPKEPPCEYEDMS